MPDQENRPPDQGRPIISQPRCHRFSAPEPQYILKADAPITVTVGEDHTTAALIHEFLRRHRLLGTFRRAETTPLKSPKRSDGKSERRRRRKIAGKTQHGIRDTLLLYAMAHRSHPDSAGVLICRDGCEDVFRDVGMGTSQGYAAKDSLVRRGLVKEFWAGRALAFELPMPPRPGPEAGRLARLEPEGPGLFSSDSDGPTGQEPVRAPSRSGPAGQEPDHEQDPKVRAPSRNPAPLIHEIHDACMYASEEEKKKAADLLRAIEFDEDKFDEPGIKTLLGSPHCEPDNIRRSVEVTRRKLEKRKRAGKKFNPVGYCYTLIRDGCSQRMTRDERQQSRQPDYMQEQAAVLRQNRAAKNAAIAQAREQLAKLSPQEFEARIREQIEREGTNSPVAKRLRQLLLTTVTAANVPDFLVVGLASQTRITPDAEAP